jgi:hypothetical protein
MPPEPTDLNDLAAIARVTKSARYRRALASATSEIERLREERDEARREVCAARKERDEATRLLYVMVEHLYGITPIDKNPKHDCGFDHRPDLGSCKFCENWTAANVILYGEEYAND